MNSTELCEEARKLLHVLNELTRAQAKAVNLYMDAIGRMSRPDTDRLRVAAHEARLRTATARSELKTHQLEHGC